MSRLLANVGEALYGTRWQTDLANALNVSDRTIRRWIASDEYPTGVNIDLLRLVMEHSLLLDHLAEKLRGKGS